jgi:hypothetical protein
MKQSISGIIREIVYMFFFMLTFSLALVVAGLTVQACAHYLEMMVPSKGISLGLLFAYSGIFFSALLLCMKLYKE